MLYGCRRISSNGVWSYRKSLSFTCILVVHVQNFMLVPQETWLMVVYFECVSFDVLQFQIEVL